MERNIFGKKTWNVQRARVDRFIVSRESVEEKRRRHSWQEKCDEDETDYMVYKYRQQKNYASVLGKTIGINLGNKRSSDNGSYDIVQAWPCIPRKKCYLSSADSILDLPTYSDAVFPELLDWSCDNILVAALGRNYHKWNCLSHSLISRGMAETSIFCCKFDPRGEFLLLGTSLKRTEIHCNKRNKMVAHSICNCESYSKESQDMSCCITAVDWSPTGNSYVTGCSSGMISSYTRSARIISLYPDILKPPIVFLRISPDARYVAASALNRNSVVLISWPWLDSYSIVGFDTWVIKGICWHPWRSAVLSIGAVTPELTSRIALCHVPSGKIEKSTIGRSKQCLDAMLFNKKSGELVLSMCIIIDEAATHPSTRSQLVVLSSPTSVVDQWGDEKKMDLDRIKTMVFSPDGTKLATATSDEDLIIWNFLPEDNVKKITDRKFSAIPVFLDKATQGFSLR